MSSSTNHPEDRTAAFTGLVVGVVALFVIVVTIVKLTDLRFGSHEKTAVETTK